MSNIYELAEQAAEHAVLNPSDEILQSETEDSKVEVPKAFIDKFAELIVRECEKTVNDIEYPYEDPAHKETWDACCVWSAEKLKEHFGVEE